MKKWKSKVTKVKSRCGFCGDTFALWSDRNDHLADHFRSGAQMKDWKGCRGLEPAVALLVQNAIPPYLIGTESNDPEPFSGSRASVGALPTAFESLTARLGEFVRKARIERAVLTDDVLRREARILLYGDDDPLNHTPADNSAWLDLFKQGYDLAHPSFDGQEVSSQTAADQDCAVSPIAMLPFTLEKMQQAAVSDFATIPLDLCGSSSYQDQIGCDIAIPWSWQTPECLAEFSQMCQAQRANNPMDMSVIAPSNSSYNLANEPDGGSVFEQATEGLKKVALPTDQGDVPADEGWMDMLFYDELFQNLVADE
ncbi:hypothetical protein PT974_07421 [Cladobotryum mycophilum]|uniref:C2H2-type domain-containing protein n=1 Tax=Cladobotryum mycophilum TaxID=491253 RepID=A0ABR0SPA6_9HYPO